MTEYTIEDHELFLKELEESGLREAQDKYADNGGNKFDDSDRENFERELFDKEDAGLESLFSYADTHRLEFGYEENKGLEYLSIARVYVGLGEFSSLHPDYLVTDDKVICFRRDKLGIPLVAWQKQFGSFDEGLASIINAHLAESKGRDHYEMPKIIIDRQKAKG